eukprot:g1671.t1
MAELGEAEEILIYYSNGGELDPPRPYKPTKLLYQHAGDGIFVVTLNDPKRLNCMSLNLVQEVTLLIEHMKRDDRCKIIVWTGSGRAFSAGGNFTDTNSTDFDGYIQAGLAVSPPDISLAGPTREMIKFPKISISAINGVTIGGGVNLGLLLLHWQDVTFRYPFGELGLTPELGSSVLLPRMVGLVRAKQLMQYGSEFTAKQALEWGLCTEVVPTNEVLPKALEAARKLVKMPQFALRESKRIIMKDTAEDRKVIGSPETQKAMMALMMKTSKSKLVTALPSERGWKQSESVLGRFGKAEAERRKWQEKWTQQCAELEELKKQSAQGAQNLQDRGRGGTWRLGDAFGGAAAIAFAWFRVAAFSAPERKKRLQHLQKVAAQSSLERLRRRMANAREDGDCSETMISPQALLLQNGAEGGAAEGGYQGSFLYSTGDLFCGSLDVYGKPRGRGILYYTSSGECDVATFDGKLNQYGEGVRYSKDRDETPAVHSYDSITPCTGFDPARYKQTKAWFAYRKLAGLPVDEQPNGPSPYQPVWR